MLAMNVECPDPPKGAAMALDSEDKAGEPFTVQLMSPADRRALEDFYLDFSPKRAAQGLPPAGAERIARWLDGVLRRGTHLLACRENRLIGHAFIIPMEPDGTGEYAVFLHQELRGRGVGTAFNAAAVATAREQGIRRLWLSVEPQNRAAVRSYEKVGFRFVRGTTFTSEAEMELTL